MNRGFGRPSDAELGGCTGRRAAEFVWYPSVLPRSLVDALVLPVADSAYEVMGYDNTVRECRAVRAEVVFLHKRFKGQFLVLDQEVGVLGRYVLNHLLLILDGPHLEWDSR